MVNYGGLLFEEPLLGKEIFIVNQQHQQCQPLLEQNMVGQGNLLEVEALKVYKSRPTLQLILGQLSSFRYTMLF